MAQTYGTVANVKTLTGIDLNPQKINADANNLDDKLQNWLDQVSSIMNKIMRKEYASTSDEFNGLSLIAEAKTADVINLAIQQRENGVIRVDNFVISVINSSDFMRDMEQTLRPFRDKGLKFQVL